MALITIIITTTATHGFTVQHNNILSTKYSHWQQSDISNLTMTVAIFTCQHILYIVNKAISSVFSSSEANNIFIVP